MRGVNSKPWVCPATAGSSRLHVREGVGASRRDGNIADYLPAIRRIAQAGGWVVRIGDPSMTKMTDVPNLIDCAHKPRRDWLDVYALGAARFMIGTNSGPVFVAGTFGVPALLSNWAPIGIKSLYQQYDHVAETSVVANPQSVAQCGRRE